MSVTEKEAWIAFSAFPTIGPNRFDLLLQNFGSAAAAWQASAKEYQELGFNPLLLEKFKEFRNTFNLKEYLDKFGKLGIETITREEDEYPERLRSLTDAPILLYIKKNKDIKLGDFSEIAIAVVGTRKPTAYGREVTQRLVTGLVDNGVTIVSGLAYGIDAIAHKAALEASGKTIGVIASGLDDITPHSNEILAKTMIESGQGIIISESPLGQKPGKHSFPIRNRIVSGMSLGVLVTEGAEKSGTLLTAASAAAQGRDVFAVPGPITSPVSRAPHILIRQGAKLVEKVEDILEEIEIESRIKNQESRKVLPQTPEEEKLLTILSAEPLDIDSLVRISSLEAGKLLGILTTMELKGIVKNIGGIYTKNE